MIEEYIKNGGNKKMSDTRKTAYEDLSRASKQVEYLAQCLRDEAELYHGDHRTNDMYREARDKTRGSFMAMIRTIGEYI